MQYYLLGWFIGFLEGLYFTFFHSFDAAQVCYENKKFNWEFTDDEYCDEIERVQDENY